MGEDYGFQNYGGATSLQSGISPNTFAGTGQSVIDTAGAGTGAAGAAGGWGSFLDSIGGWVGGKDKNGNTQVGALGAGLGALQGLGNLYAGFQSYGLAKQQLALQQKAYETNLRNSVSSYNTALEDKIRGRSSNYAGKEADVQSYLASHKLST
ncbi:hypothetical protein [Pantoea eucrina]|uniref:hypothetical protein n=1 Tax=Pantoea eucrina TaxID=472693 RepID=UPI00080F59C2|nr:hypothetical protein [Pantoea eucrina]